MTGVMSAVMLQPGMVVRFRDYSGGRWNGWNGATTERTVVEVRHGGWDAWGKEQAEITWAGEDSRTRCAVDAEFAVVSDPGAPTEIDQAAAWAVLSAWLRGDIAGRDPNTLARVAQAAADLDCALNTGAVLLADEWAQHIEEWEIP